MRVAPVEDTDKLPVFDVPIQTIPIFRAPLETDQPPPTIEEEIKRRQEQGIDMRTTAAFPGSGTTPPVPEGTPWGLLATVAGYLIFG